MSLEQEGYQFYNDDGSQASATTKASQDANVSLALDTLVRLRVLVNANSTAPATSQYRLEYKESGATDYSPVVTSGGAIVMAASANISASGEATTARLVAPSGKSAGGSFTTGRIWDDENGLDSVPLADAKYTELEWSIKATSPATLGQVYSFRVSRLPVASAGVAPSVRWSDAVWDTADTGIRLEPASGAFATPAVAGDRIVVIVTYQTTNNTDTLAGSSMAQNAGTGTFGTWTLDYQNVFHSGSTSMMVAFYSAVCTVGGTIQVVGSGGTLAAGATRRCIGMMAISGCDISGSFLDGTATGASFTASPGDSGSLTTTGAAICIGGLVTDTPTTLTIGGGFTQLQNNTGSLWGYRTDASAGAKNFTSTLGASGNGFAAIIGYKSATP